MSEPKKRGRPAQTICKRGHPIEPGNIFMGSDGHRRCLTCHRAARDAWEMRNRRSYRAITGILPHGRTRTAKRLQSDEDRVSSPSETREAGQRANANRLPGTSFVARTTSCGLHTAARLEAQPPQDGTHATGGHSRSESVAQTLPIDGSAAGRDARGKTPENDAG